MQVITLHNEDLNSHARQLAEMVLHNHPQPFDAIVGIRNGGSIVCDIFCRHFPADNYLLRSDLSLQRPSTKKKGSRFSQILKRLPTPILDYMRMGESLWLELWNGKNGKDIPPVQISEQFYHLLSSKESPDILIIDDAIDSGRTLAKIIESIKIVNPNVRIQTAVFTVTTPDPCANADYSLYQNRTLIRFPWSNDYKSL